MASFEQTDRVERSVLGGALRYGEVMADLIDVLRQEDFRQDGHRSIWSAMVALFDAGKPVDAASVAEVLTQRGQLDNAGGYAYLAKLLDETPTGAQAVYHARIVREHSILRQLAAAGAQITHDAENPADSAEATLESAERLIFSIAEQGVGSQAHSLADTLTETCARIDSRAREGRVFSGLGTGFEDLDELTAGLQPSELIILAARPSIGKTALALAIAKNAALVARLPVFFVSLEQSRTELGERLLCAEAGVDAQRLRKGRCTPADMDHLSGALGQLRGGLLWIDDSPRQNMLRIAAVARRHKRKHDIALVVIDYLQLIEPDNRKEPRHEQVAGISRRLKGLARDLAIPVLALAQLNRNAEERAGGRPRLADLRESGSLEADADTVLLMHRPDVADHANGTGDLVEVIVAKQRNGPVGDVRLRFDRSKLRFNSDTAPDVFAGAGS
jgi:replicative DNA helicase